MTRRGLLGPIAALATLAVLGTAGGASAVWVTNAVVSASASSATVATTMQLTGGLSTTSRFSGTASTAVAGQFTITNTGRAPLSYRLESAIEGDPVLAQKTALRLWTGTCGTTAPAGAVVTTLADTAPALPPAARTVAPGASVVVCVATRVEGATNALLQGRTVTASFSTVGMIGDNWRADAGAQSITQTVYRLAPAGTPTCAAVGRGVKLSWTAPTNRADNGNITYRVLDASTRSVIATVTSPATSMSVQLTGDDISRNGTYELVIEAAEAGGSATTALDSGAVSVRRSTIILDLLQIFPRYECS